MAAFQKIEREAMQLDAKARARLAARLLESLDTLSEAEAERLWLEEAERRFSAYDKGKMKSSAAREAVGRIRKRLAS